MNINDGCNEAVRSWDEYEQKHRVTEYLYDIREYQQMKAASFREQLEKFNRQELLKLRTMLEEYRKGLE